MAYFEIKDFRKTFGNTEVLRGIDFSMEKGEVVSIIGSSGSGKTTLLRCINLIEQADVGTMTLGGEMLFDGKQGKQKEKDLRYKRMQLGLVFQNFNLFPQYTVLKNVMLAPMLHNKEIAKSKQELRMLNEKSEADARELIEQIGLTEKIDFYPSQLSGGQQQRVAIARALAINPGVLCFDEPTSALDPELTREVLKVILDLKRRGRTMIVVTHEMEFARKVSSKVIFMANGVIEEEGHPEELFENPKSPILKNFLLSSKEGFDGEVDLSK